MGTPRRCGLDVPNFGAFGGAQPHRARPPRPRDRELGELPRNVVGRSKENAPVRFRQHRGVIVRVAGGDDLEVEQLERHDGLALAVADAQAIVGDAPALVDDERVAEKAGVIELGHQRRCELVERVGEDDHLESAAQPAQEFERAVEWAHLADHVLDVG
jgi:hypothetical protein